MGVSIRVNDFRWEPGKNDAEYIKLLESSRDEWQKIAQKAIAKLKALSKAQEPHIVTIADYKNNPNVDKDGNLAVWRESRHFNGIAYHEDGWIVLNRDRVEGWFNSEVIRFWTSRPTEAEREATPWE